jgi:hypothetical protein
MSFSIISVPPESVVGDEQLGSKTKFWFDHGGGRWLFKEARENSGEDWAERIASAIATLIKISTAHVELSEFKGRRGCASRSFVTVENESLVHGNEILAVQIHGYDRSKKLRQADHTIKNIFIAITKLFASAEQTRDEVLFQLAEYLVLDALIGNTDRHHENWGLLVRDVTGGINESAGARIRVAPSFDHASSLGRELRDEKRKEIVQRETIASYVHRARGGVYLKQTDPHGANPLELIQFASQEFPLYFRTALKKVSSVSIEPILTIIDDVPDARMSLWARLLAKAFLTYTHSALRKLSI